MIIPWEDLSDDALTNLIREFVLREGTDYGAVEQSLEAKENQIRNQLKSKRSFVVFDQSDETITILSKEQVQGMQVKE